MFMIFPHEFSVGNQGVVIEHEHEITGGVDQGWCSTAFDRLLKTGKKMGNVFFWVAMNSRIRLRYSSPNALLVFTVDGDNDFRIISKDRIFEQAVQNSLQIASQRWRYRWKFEKAFHFFEEK
jgi:hypothetical protein